MTTYQRWERRQRRQRLAAAIAGWIIVVLTLAISLLGLWTAASLILGIPAPGR